MSRRNVTLRTLVGLRKKIIMRSSSEVGQHLVKGNYQDVLSISVISSFACCDTFCVDGSFEFFPCRNFLTPCPPLAPSRLLVETDLERPLNFGVCKGACIPLLVGFVGLSLPADTSLPCRVPGYAVVFEVMRHQLVDVLENRVDPLQCEKHLRRRNLNFHTFVGFCKKRTKQHEFEPLVQRGLFGFVCTVASHNALQSTGHDVPCLGAPPDRVFPRCHQKQRASGVHSPHPIWPCVFSRCDEDLAFEDDLCAVAWQLTWPFTIFVWKCENMLFLLRRGLQHVFGER